MSQKPVSKDDRATSACAVEVTRQAGCLPLPDAEALNSDLVAQPHRSDAAGLRSRSAMDRFAISGGIEYPKCRMEPPVPFAQYIVLAVFFGNLFLDRNPSMASAIIVANAKSLAFIQKSNAA